MYAGSYGLSSADGQAQPTGSQARGVTWPVRSGLVPPLAEGFIARPDTVPGLEAGDTVPGLEAALVPGAAVALVPGEDAGSAPDWPGSSGKTRLASWPDRCGVTRSRPGGAAVHPEPGASSGSARYFPHGISALGVFI